MSDPSNIAVILTIPYAAPGPAALTDALDYWIGRKVRRIVMLADPRGPGWPHAGAAAEAARPRCVSAGVDLSFHEVQEPETASYWRWGMLEAFGTPGIEACILMPGDSTEAIGPEVEHGLSRMLEEATAQRLILGDYDSHDPFKEEFDERLTRPLLACLYPDLVNRLAAVPLTKLRSEFLCLGRGVFERLLARDTERWGPDPTVQLLLVALQTPELEVRVVRLGTFDDTPNRVPINQLHQIVRLATQLLADYTCGQFKAGRTSPIEQQWRQYDQVRQVLGNALSQVACSLDRNRRAKAMSVIRPGAASRYVYRAAYLVLEGTEYDRWVLGLWDGSLSPDDPLYPHGAHLGEVTAWGRSIHFTLTDALTTTDPEEFGRAVRAICQAVPSPEVLLHERSSLPDPARGGSAVRQTALSVWKSALVVQCQGAAAQRLRVALQVNTSHLIARAPISDEEWSRATWWVEKAGGDVNENLTALRRARERYDCAGAAALPSSRHFRLSTLVELSRALDRGNKHAARRWDHFLRHGEPCHYRSSGGLHTTIVSGLPEDQRELPYVSGVGAIHDKLVATFKPVRLPYVAIMTEDPRETVEVRFYDHLTQSFVKESRPAFREIERVPFGDAAFSRGEDGRSG
jgi:hypothetical protein